MARRRRWRLIVLLLPVVIVVLAGLTAGEYLTFPPQGLSLRWVIAFLQSPTFFGAYLFSLELAAITMVISTVIGTMASIYLTRSQVHRREGRCAVCSCRRSFCPGIVLGIALYVFYVSTDIGLARTFGGLLIGHVLVTCPFVIATVSASLVGFDLSLEEAARSLGAGPLQAFRLVTLKIISPAVGRGLDLRLHYLVRPVRSVALSRHAEPDRAALRDVHLAALQVRADRRRRGHFRDRAGRRSRWCCRRGSSICASWSPARDCAGDGSARIAASRSDRWQSAHSGVGEVIMDDKSKTKLSRRTVLKGAAAAAAAPTMFNINHAWSKDVIWDGKPFDAGGAELRMAEWGGFWEELVRKYLLPDFEKDYNCKIAWDSGVPVVPEIRRRRTEEPASRDRQLEPRGHVPRRRARATSSCRSTTSCPTFPTPPISGTSPRSPASASPGPMDATPSAIAPI